MILRPYFLIGLHPDQSITKHGEFRVKITNVARGFTHPEYPDIDAHLTSRRTPFWNIKHQYRSAVWRFDQIDRSSI